MATASKCPYCQKTNFDIFEDAPKGSSYSIVFVRCSACGTVVGTLDAINPNHSIRQQNVVLNKIAKHFGIPSNLPED